MKAASRIIVKGTVQGVFFRQFVKEHADKLNLKGFVRNIETGEVELVAEGEKEQIERLVLILKKGTEHSHIRDVEVRDMKWSGEYKEFKILRF